MKFLFPRDITKRFLYPFGITAIMSLFFLLVGTLILRNQSQTLNNKYRDLELVIFQLTSFDKLYHDYETSLLSIDFTLTSVPLKEKMNFIEYKANLCLEQI